jgi:BirA family transcriptional regulator, biotin operon repressor / biotin---[acetyl-CoA-carboxylase] ligase
MAAEVDDPFNLPALNAALAGTRFLEKLHFYPSIPSTNSYAIAEAETGASDGCVYFADEQESGRGRGAHNWSSPPGSGLYLSVLLRPAIAPADALWFSLAAGLAVRDAVRQVTSLECDLRWPNDLLLGGRKFCGILTELNAEVTRVHHLVIGVGINVHQPSFPAELRDIATSLHMETSRDWPRQDLLAALLRSLDSEVTALTTPGDLAQATAGILDRLERASSWIRGKRVYVDEMEGYAGVTEGLDSRGFLRVRAADGLRTVFSGGVREQKSIR